jgi:hypothetical protein
VLGSHSKKRPHNITLGRLYDFHLYDALELGVESHKPISSFRGAGTAQVGNKVSSSFPEVKLRMVLESHSSLALQRKGTVARACFPQVTESILPPPGGGIPVELQACCGSPV